MYGVSIAVARGNKTANIATGNMKNFIFALKGRQTLLRLMCSVCYGNKPTSWPSSIKVFITDRINIAVRICIIPYNSNRKSGTCSSITNELQIYFKALQ